MEFFPTELDFIRLARAINLQGRSLHCHVIMDGGFMFAADLLRRLPNVVDTTIHHVRSGYRPKDKAHAPQLLTTNPLFILKDTHLLIDVITETGATFKMLKGGSRAKILTCAFIWKAPAPQPNFFVHKYTEGKFLEGYGMGPRRWLPYITEVEEP